MRVFLKIKNTMLFLQLQPIPSEPARFTILRFASNFDEKKDAEYIKKIIQEFKEQNVAELEVFNPVYENNFDKKK